MIHRNSLGAPCEGCPPDCEDRDLAISLSGVEVRECCAMRNGPHGPLTFDDNGDIANMPTCCAGFSHQTGKVDESACGGHGGRPEWTIKVKGPKVAGLAPSKKAGAKANKVAAALNALNGINDPSKEHAAILANGKVIRGGVRWNEDTGDLEAEAIVLEKKVNPFNPDPEWHHRKPTAAEKASIEASLRASLA